MAPTQKVQQLFNAKAPGLSVWGQAFLNAKRAEGLAPGTLGNAYAPVLSAFFGLLPIMWSTGAGADVMKRIAAPMVGGLFTSFALELLVYPAIYLLWRRRVVVRG